MGERLGPRSHLFSAESSVDSGFPKSPGELFFRGGEAILNKLRAIIIPTIDPTEVSTIPTADFIDSPSKI